MDKKNLIIAVLAVLLVFGSLWGQVGNKNSKMLRHELEQAEQQLSTVETANSQTHDAVLTKAAELQKTLQGKEKQLTMARKELVSLRKTNKGLEAKLSERDAAVQKLTDEKKQLAAVAEKVVAAPVVAEDAGKVADLEKQVAALQKALKKKRPQSGRTQSAVIIQLADAQKQVMALQKELKKKNQLLAGQQGTVSAEVSADLNKKIAVLQDELKSKDAQLAQIQSSAVEQITVLKKELSALKQEAPAVEEHPVVVVEGVTPIQFAYLHAELKKRDMQLTHALNTITDLQKELVALQTEPVENDEVVLEVVDSGADKQVAELEKKIAALEAELATKGEQSVELATKDEQPGLKPFVRVQGHKDDKNVARRQAELKANVDPQAQEQIASLKKELQSVQAELKVKEAELAGLQQNHVTDQVISHLQKTMDTLRGELKSKDAQFLKVRDTWVAQVEQLKQQVANLMNEIMKRDQYIASLQNEQAQESTAVVDQQVVAELQNNLNLATTRIQELEQALQNNLNLASTRIQELEQALQSAEQPQQVASVDSNELEMAKAQIFGLEKIVEEKNIVIDEISQTLDRVKINMKVLLNKIGDQQDALQEVQEANRELVKELTAKNQELADLQEQVQTVPAQ